MGLLFPRKVKYDRDGKPYVKCDGYPHQIEWMSGLTDPPGKGNVVMLARGVAVSEPFKPALYVFRAWASALDLGGRDFLGVARASIPYPQPPDGGDEEGGDEP